MADSAWYALNDTSVNASVYDIDLFTKPPSHPTSTFQNPQSMGLKIICYFSGGSHEPGRPDSNKLLIKVKALMAGQAKFSSTQALPKSATS
jgi:Glycoside-hydrolase family GH114